MARKVWAGRGWCRGVREKTTGYRYDASNPSAPTASPLKILIIKRDEIACPHLRVVEPSIWTGAGIGIGLAAADHDPKPSRDAWLMPYGETGRRASGRNAAVGKR